MKHELPSDKGDLGMYDKLHRVSGPVPVRKSNAEQAMDWWTAPDRVNAIAVPTQKAKEVR